MLPQNVAAKSSILCQARQNIKDFAATFCGNISRRAEQNLSGPIVQAVAHSWGLCTLGVICVVGYLYMGG